LALFLDKAPDLGNCVTTSIVSEPFNRFYCLAVRAESVLHSLYYQIDHKAASMSFVVANKIMISLSQSSDNFSLTFSLLLHENSKPSEHQRTSLSWTATLP